MTDDLRLPQRFSVPEVLEVLKISRPTLYARVKAGLLRVTKDGGRTFVTGAELARYLAACEASSPTP